ncbi:ABC transporter permease [Ktedonosporobacter rubrisoli]|uniref:ABC transporter permease n=1 Tax=Ktedonosporobacter rubrisoli TaxID=2509675 RepID=A0A4P6K1J8_KTERU|nr:ABC transporter permease [Ktedonosporobacter rubrisoli]QBD81702.1 ABC transporter permease [Ktedonosporobacter rubrisoli]
MNYLLSPYNYDLSDPGSIPNLIWQHAFLVGVSMLIALIIAIPVGLFVARHRQFYFPVITFTGLLYTIPGIALLGILITVTGLSFTTAIIPLVLYAQLVLIRNTATAVNGIDPLLLEVGRAMGMSPRQLLFRVTLPLALPVIVAGIRIATVTTVGIASLDSLVGEGGLGDLIFKNITSGDTQAVIAGAILMALFAIVADLLLLLVQTALNRGRSALSVA